MAEQAVLFQQLCRRTHLNHAAAGEQDDLIGVHDGTHAVRDDEHRLIPDKPGQCRLHRRFVFHVQRGRCLIQQNHRRVLQDGAGNGDALPLAAGETGAVFPDQGMVALRQLGYKGVALRRLRRRQHLRIGGVPLAEADVSITVSANSTTS